MRYDWKVFYGIWTTMKEEPATALLGIAVIALTIFLRRKGRMTRLAEKYKALPEGKQMVAGFAATAAGMLFFVLYFLLRRAGRIAFFLGG